MLDLHLHSTCSDGTFTPSELVAEALRQSLTAIALTDHDTVDGVAELTRAAEGTGLEAVAGIEISAEFGSGEGMHILGYLVRPDDSQLQDRLNWMREGRRLRNQEILSKLQALDIRLTPEDVRKHAGTHVICRPHVAMALVEKGYVSSTREAFDRYLGKSRPAYVPRRRLSPAESIRLITDSGGVPVLAHPGTLQIGRNALSELLLTLKDSGLQGLEVHHPQHEPSQRRRYAELAAGLDLVATGGSDFHGALTPDLTMGRGFGDLRVPDETLAQLRARRPG